MLILKPISHTRFHFWGKSPRIFPLIFLDRPLVLLAPPLEWGTQIKHPKRTGRSHALAQKNGKEIKRKILRIRRPVLPIVCLGFHLRPGACGEFSPIPLFPLFFFHFPCEIRVFLLLLEKGSFLVTVLWKKATVIFARGKKVHVGKPCVCLIETMSDRLIFFNVAGLSMVFSPFPLCTVYGNPRCDLQQKEKLPPKKSGRKKQRKQANKKKVRKKHLHFPTFPLSLSSGRVQWGRISRVF